MIEDRTMDVEHNLPARIAGEGNEKQTESDIAVQEGPPDVDVPRKYKVIMLNDDYTTMDFVVEVLKRFFAKTGEEAVQIMLQVHELGRGVCGVYSREIAETKVAQVHEFARNAGFPLKCSMEAL
jgi:ATP-dependent Clp protease adaptor protein ClpS